MTGGRVHEDQNRLATPVFLFLLTSLTLNRDTFSSFGHFRYAQGCTKSMKRHTLSETRPGTLTFKKGSKFSAYLQRMGGKELWQDLAKETCLSFSVSWVGNKYINLRNVNICLDKNKFLKIEERGIT